MQTYKAPDNSLHVIEPEFAHLLPIGCVPITEAEADAIRAAQPVPAPPVPQQVTRAQGKAVLIQMGLWQSVLDFVAAIPDATQKALAEVALHDTQFWQRNSPFLNTAATALGITQEQMDALFIQASQVQL